MLARPPACTTRTTPSGCVGSSIMSPTTTVQVEPLGADAGELRLVELELDHLSLARARHRGVADAAAGLRGDLVDVDRRLAVEHQPDRVGAAEHRGRRRHDEREGEAQRLALAAHVDHDRRRGIGGRRALRPASRAPEWSRAARTVRAAACAGSAAVGSDDARRRLRRACRRDGLGVLPVRRACACSACATAGCACGWRAARFSAAAGADGSDLSGSAALRRAARSAAHRRRNCCPRGTCGRPPCR